VDRYTARVSYVEGEFYWRVQRDDELLTEDYSGIGAMSARKLSSEASGSEVVWSEGSTIPASTVRSAFDLKPGPLPSFAISTGSFGSQHDVGPLSNGSEKLVQYAVVALFILIFLSSYFADDDDDGSAAGYGYVYGSGIGHK